MAQLSKKLPLRPRWTDKPELLDRPGHDQAVLAGNLADLRRVNRLLGGARLTVRGLERLTWDLGPGAGLTIVDVATGGADIPGALLDWARRRRLRVRVVATDLSLEVLRVAARDAPIGVDIVAADARALPFANASVDVAICSLVLHHLRPDDAVTMLREMQRVARRGVVVNDLDRNWLGFVGTWLAGRLLTRNPLTRHDGPLSVRRAYTRAEMAMLAGRAGLGPVSFEGFLGYRMAMTAGPAA
jgi:ubiquinone/menaquinone biosynthesis C-methylase UbiE